MKISELNFKTLTDEDNAPDLTCDYCGEEKEAAGQLAAEIRIDASLNVAVIMCSDKCLYDWKHTKYADEMLTEKINAMRKQRRMQAIKIMGK